MPVDLGAYVNVNQEDGVEEVDPAALLQPSIFLGYSYVFSEESDVFFTIGPSVGVDPGFGDAEDATRDVRWFIAPLNLGVYIPFFDFN